MIYNFTTDKSKIMRMIERHQYWDQKRIVFTNGCFDIFHAGHVNLLNETKKMGDVLIVGMNSDKSVKLLKGEGRPINNQDDRSLILSSICSVDEVIIFDEYSVIDLIKFIKPTIITKGGDYDLEQLTKDGGDFMKEIGGQLILIPITVPTSTTKIINKLK
jgi:D-beta-D-heptose 7-phosphate kinase/D-beta-D-heptose 1-phosphate adenosyltransferase